MALLLPTQNGGRERTLDNSYRVAVAVLSFQEMVAEQHEQLCVHHALQRL
jgi:hypothetical protein